MKVGVAVVLLSLVLGVCHGIVKSVPEEGYDVIHLDWPSFVHEFRFNDNLNKFYAYGAGLFREIDHGETLFQAVENRNLSDVERPFIDSRMFSSGNEGHDLYTIGITPFLNPPTQGYFFPLSLFGPNRLEVILNSTTKEGYTFYGLTVDHRSFSDLRVYLAGWYLSSVYTVQFVLVRAHINLAATPPVWSWTEDTDKVVLHQGSYVPYHSTFKPRLIFDAANNNVFVVDPASETIFKVTAPADGVSQLTLVTSLPLVTPTRYLGSLAGANWHFYNDYLFVGFAGYGEFNGSLVSVNLKTMVLEKIFHFPFLYSNPRAIAGSNETADVWIAFEGGPAIVRFNFNEWKITGYARLPPNLHQVFTGWDTGFNHVYFATYEQHSKIFRIDKRNFCASDCPYNGFCSQHTCTCIDGYELSQNKEQCVIKPTTIHDLLKDQKGAAIALGILFALTTVAAIIGWVMFYRARKGAYTRVL